MHPNIHLLDHSLIARSVTVLRDRDTSVVEFRAHVRAVARGLAFQATQWLPQFKPRLHKIRDTPGLVSLLDSLKDCWSPNLTPDRLEAMLSLMSDCGLIQKIVVDGTSLYSKEITH